MALGRINFVGDRLGPQACYVAAAIIGSGVVGAGAGIYSANQARKTQQAGVNKAIDTQNRMFDTATGYQEPFIQAGQNVLPQIADMTSGDPNKINAALEALPGYQFTKTQGLKSVQNSAAARGLGASGAALKGAANYATGLADNTFGNQFNRLLDTARIGSNSAGQLGSQAVQTGASIGSNIIGGSNAAAASDIAMGNSVQGGLNGITGGLILNKLLDGGGATGRQSTSAFAPSPYTGNTPAYTEMPGDI